MRRCFIGSIMILVFQCSGANSNLKVCNFSITDTSTYPISNLSAISWSCYLNQPINILLFDLDRLFPDYVLSKVYPGHQFFAHDIIVYYSRGVGVRLSVNKFKVMNPAHTAKWDVDLFRKENLSKIELWQNDTCLYNSEE